jgi:hypothetical protein
MFTLRLGARRILQEMQWRRGVAAHAVGPAQECDVERNIRALARPTTCARRAKDFVLARNETG